MLFQTTQWHDGKRCLLRDGASAALGDCDKGGAQGWGLRGGRLTVNKGKDCLARDLANKARVVSCTLGHEHLLPEQLVAAQGGNIRPSAPRQQRPQPQGRSQPLTVVGRRRTER